MRSPIQFVTGPVVWPRQGEPWGVWRIGPRRWHHCTQDVQDAIFTDLQATVGRLRSPSLLLGVAEPLSDEEIARRTRSDTVLDEAARVARMETAAPPGFRNYERSYWLATQFSERPTQKERFLSYFRVASSEFGVPEPIPDTQIVRSFDVVRNLTIDLFGNDPDVRPAEAHEVVWLIGRLLRRGDIDLPISHWDDPAFCYSRHTKEAQWIEYGSGVLSGLYDRRFRPVSRTHDRQIAVDDGHQATLVMQGGPTIWDTQAGVDVGGSVLANVERIADYLIDWAVRIEPIAHEDVTRKIRSRKRQMTDQFDQHAGDTAGVPEKVHSTNEGLAEEEVELGENREPEDPALITFTVYSDDPKVTARRANDLEAMLRRDRVTTGRPRRSQLALLTQQVPGTRTPRIFGDYRQHLTPGGIAGLAPFCGARVGDPKGLPFAINRDSGLRELVLLDPPYPILQADDDDDTAGNASIAVVGGTGAGKSYALKRIMRIVLEMGGMGATMDRTKEKEWARFAYALSDLHRVNVVSAVDGLSADPFVCLPRDDAEQGIIGFLATLAGCGAVTAQGALIADAVHEAMRLPNPRLINVLDLLSQWGGDGRGNAHAEDLYRRLSIFSRSSYGQLVFDPNRKGVSLDADFIVFSATGLVLPSREQLANESLTNRMLPEEVWGQALSYLFTYLCRWHTFRPGRFGLQLVDEAWSMFRSDHGKQILHEGVRESRRAFCGTVFSSQDDEDYPPEILSLLGSILVGKMEGKSAVGGARMLGVEPIEEARIRALPKKQGCFLYRDVRGRRANIQILPERDPRIHEAMDTRPKAEAEVEGPTGLLVGDDGLLGEMESA